jgi:hypothetical protein
MHNEQKTITTGLYKNTGDVVKLAKVTIEVRITEGSSRLQNVYFVYVYNIQGYVSEIHQFDTLVKAQRKFDRLNGLGK